MVMFCCGCHDGIPYCCPCCFWDQGLVEKLAGSQTVRVPAAAIEPGDRVRTTGGFKRVVYVHVGRRDAVPILRVRYRAEDGSAGETGLTPNHLLFTDGAAVARAGALRVGDRLQAFGGAATVTGVAPGSATVRSLVTSNGELLVDGLRVSSYAFDARLHRLTRCVSWLGRVHAALPHRVCEALAPAVVQGVFPVVFRAEPKRLRAAERHPAADPGETQRPAPTRARPSLGGALKAMVPDLPDVKAAGAKAQAHRLFVV